MLLDKQNGITERIIQCFYSVYNELGYGFLENVYQNAMYLELKNSGFNVECQKEIQVCYKGQIVGKYKADLIVEDKIILELKTAERITIEHELQLVNYLKATSFEVGLLLNFGEEPQVRRRLYDNKPKSV
ncbi:MAG: GxxExxY protein [Oscillospiraceae bacterium]|nr:GxxExxY protein [Oscillospiraceae bacterium]